MEIKPFHCFYLILAIILYVLNIVFSFKFAKYNLEENGITLEIINSLEGKLIYSFELKNNCSSEEEILSLGEYEGFKEGCKFKDKNKDEQCSDDDIENNCTKTQLKFQKINSKYICVKKSKDTYIDLIKSKQIVSKDSECPNNYKSCGIIDTLENILCAPKNDACPITMADIENSNIIHKNNSIYNINSTNSQILSMFILTENMLPCIVPGENIWRMESNRKCNKTIFGQLYDDRYEKINGINTTEYELYKDNSMLEFYQNITIKKNLNQTIYLYARSFIGFKSESIDKYENYKSLISKQILSNSCGNVLKYLFEIPLGILSILQGGVYGSDAALCCLILLALMIILIIVSFFIDFILCIIILIYSLNIEYILCIKASDKFTNELIQILIDEHSINFSFSLANVIIFVIIAIIGITYLARKKCKVLYEKIKLAPKKCKDFYKKIKNKFSPNEKNNKKQRQDFKDYKISGTDFNEKNECNNKNKLNAAKIDVFNNAPLNSDNISIKEEIFDNRISNDINSNNNLKNNISVDEKIVVKEEKNKEFYKSKTITSKKTNIYSLEEEYNDSMPSKEKINIYKSNKT